MTIEKAARHPIALTIDQTANGYMVTEVVGHGEVAMFADAHVFPSQAALFEYLAGHFTIRTWSVPLDAAPPLVTIARDHLHVGDLAGTMTPNGLSAIDPNIPAGDAPGFKNFGRRE